MRLIQTSLAVLSVALIAACASPPEPINRVDVLRTEIGDPASDYVVVVAHRGCWESAPENSIASIEACIASGVDMVELDVRATADGQLVLMHDITLDRTTNLSGALSDFTLNSLSDARLREGAGGPGAAIDPRDQAVPTLREALIAARDKVLVNIDAKADLHEAIFEVVDETGTGDQVIMKMRAAPDDPALTEATFVGRSLFMPVIVQCGETGLDDTRFCATDLATLYDDYLPLNPVAFEIVYTEEEFLWPAVPLMRRNGRVWVNTLKPQFSAGKSDAAALQDPEGVWGRLVDGGVSMIQTDHPLVLVDFLKRTGRRGNSLGALAEKD